MNKIIGIYKITNTITCDCYIGSSKNVKKRWAEHKCKSIWKRYPNKQLYQDMQKYGLDKFSFEILEVVEEEQLKETEQQFIEILKPTYNNYYAKGIDVGRKKETKRKYNKEYQKEYKKSDKYQEYQKEYKKSDKYQEYQKEYNNQLCNYNGQTITLHALYERFRKAGIDHPTQEAKKYLLEK